MIPYLLTLKDFLSYHQASLDFRGLHTACICGANGAGKSSLLEAIGWAIWGQSRVAAEDDIIRSGTEEAQVDFVFQIHQQIYRIIRRRRRAQGLSLEFQVATGTTDTHTPATLWFDTFSWRSLTEKGVRPTQQKILQQLRLDYDTFTNSAYLRQGKADEFMLKRPGDRKQVLAELLKLDRYEELAEKAKDTSRRLKAWAETLQQQLAAAQATLAEQPALTRTIEDMQARIEALQQRQAGDRDTLQTLQARQHQRATWQQQLHWHQQQIHTLTGERQRRQQEIATAQTHQQELEALLQQERDILNGYEQYRALQAHEEETARKYQADRALQQAIAHLQQQLDEQLSALKERSLQRQTQRDNLQQQERDLHPFLAKASEVEAALEQLHQAKQRLGVLDRTQTQIAPLLQRQHALQRELDRTQSRYAARLEELNATAQRLQRGATEKHPLQEGLRQVEAALAELEKTRTYLQRVKEKGLERRNFLDSLKVRQQTYEHQLKEVDRKLELLQSSNTPEGAAPACPLCDRPLDNHHQQRVWQKTQAQRKELQDFLWVVADQLATSEREIQVLRQEYREVEQKLDRYNALLERRAWYVSQLAIITQEGDRLTSMAQERQQLVHLLQNGVAPEIEAELHHLEATLKQHNYDEKNHAIARGEVERWRWAEIKWAEIQQAQRRLNQIAEQLPQLTAEIDRLHQQQQDLLHHSELAHRLAEVHQKRAELAYDIDRHNALRQEVDRHALWQGRYQELQSAQQRYPHAIDRVRGLQANLHANQQQLQALHQQAETLREQLSQAPDCTEEIAALEGQIEQRQSQLDEAIAQLGRLQQQQQHLDTLAATVREQQQQLQQARRRSRVYEELTQAFGKKGIQALMIENILPQLEAETNRILARLSANQLHVQFVTQKASRSSGKASRKLIDTLDILIADTRGTRAYETYSGGEAFRVNFAIRLAMARLLAQRSGTPLQMLIVDEGFGTQDQEGCDRLIAAIQGIASEFACILAVSHIPYIKEAFQTRIEVRKTENGSQIYLSF